ncbi:hypothetical protein GUITHDRAFT_106274 [Guillardia theta CCMP2712]|uniref:C-type lectin domain-containing protein n=1 Tax=Guillardia theta (strain CCMP2712) TaxID=905079 RepID=L1JHB8_GUITC|nr:hypothetical protein GUITHDRAFT_106274 [Guillardia theta CCMP2712]EKX47722.1 hypothetical protein GUITHDRAFT_106274 [Guillardia theta CCMP2712]|eukprot:XP_005834702.1 hypothetical protein GUITHDRAFT_106274 [Guillardia theta CCMP2712]
MTVINWKQDNQKGFQSIVLNKIMVKDRYILAIPIHRVCPDSSFCNPLTIHWRCFKGNAKPGRDYLPSSGQISWPANVQGIRYAFVSVRLTGRLPYPVYFSLVIAPSVGSACGSACSFASECDASLVCKDTWTLAEYSQFDVEPSRCLNSCTCSLPTGNLTKPASCSGVEPLSNQNILIPSSKALTTVRISRCYKSSPAAGACLPDELHPCGDGYRHVNEECDDGNTVDGDGCSAQCAVEDFYSCVGGTSTSQDRCSFNSPGLLSPIEWLNTQGALRAGQLYQNIQWADEMFWNYNVYGQPVAQAIGCLVDPNSPFTLNMPASPFISTSPANCARIASLLGYAGFCRQYAGQCYTQRDFIFTVSSLKPSNTCVGNSGGEGSMYCYYVSYHTSSLYFVQQHDPCQIPGYCSPIGICDSNLASVPIQVSCTCNQSLSFGNGEFCSIHETQNLNCHGASSIWSSGICFFLASESIQYGSASSVCAAEGANVASILSATQNSAASSLLPFGQSAWIGYVKEGAAFDWTQSSLTPQIQVLSSTYTAWAGGEPIHNGSCTGSTCDKNALCRDQINGYTCECKSGFSGSGNAGAPEEVTGSRNQGVFFNGSLPATAIQYARLGYAAADPDAWLDRPHAILQDGESVFVQVDLGRIFPIGNIKLYINLDNTVRFLRLSVFTNVGVACAACPLGTIGKAGEPNTCLRCNRTEAAANCSRQDNASQTETSTCLPIASCWQGQGKMYNGTCFRVFENSSGVTWKEANESCWRHGGELGMVKVAHDQDLINSLILTPAWLGWSGELRYTSDTSWELLNSSWVDGQSASSVRLSGVCDFLECSGSFSTAQVCGMTARGGMFPSLCDASLNAYVCFKVVPSETCSVR